MLVPLEGAALEDVWDIGLIAVEPARWECIDFARPYTEIEAINLASRKSAIQTTADAGQSGARIVIAAGSGYDLYLSCNLKHAKLVGA